ncbi:VCBS repeat-containing protein [Massilia sp. NR 4-1]|uniref:FG-GAP repeat domain-containing protein n=1 Tax=Massilia sp. NR 4-1 TaxID=1678028 RepID=UPI0009E2465A|nr:VCBS repeat-containing protein [Massilia sp. NR 4-1]
MQAISTRFTRILRTLKQGFMAPSGARPQPAATQLRHQFAALVPPVWRAGISAVMLGCAIPSMVAAQDASGRYASFGLADWDSDGHQDIVTRENANGNLWLYPGESRRGYSGTPRVKIGNGWNSYSFFGLADWDGDGHADIITQENASGNLWLYPGESKRGYSSAPRVQIGNGWNGYSFFGVADWDHDGHQDIVVRENASGNLWLYPGESKRGYSSAPRVQIGNGWNGYTAFGLADWDHDGHQDILTRENVSGNLWLYPGESKRGYSGAARVQIGNGW